MNDLFDFLLTNGIIVLGVLGWLYSIFKKDKDQDEKKEKPVSQPKQSTNTTTTNSSSAEIGSESKKDLQTYAERQRERYRDLQNGTKQVSTKGASGPIHDALPDEGSHNHYQRDDGKPYQRDETVPYERDQSAPYQRDQLKPFKSGADKTKVELTGVHKLSQKKLAQSLIMAEVLGPPRSQKSYRSK